MQENLLISFVCVCFLWLLEVGMHVVAAIFVGQAKKCQIALSIIFNTAVSLVSSACCYFTTFISVCYCSLFVGLHVVKNANVSGLNSFETLAFKVEVFKRIFRR